MRTLIFLRVLWNSRLFHEGILRKKSSLRKKNSLKIISKKARALQKDKPRVKLEKIVKNR
jgi:hypothetical protein